MSQATKITPSSKDQLRRKLQLGVHDPTHYGARPTEHYKNSLYEKPPQDGVKNKQ
jgi:hypothetical protein